MYFAVYIKIEKLMSLTVKLSNKTTQNIYYALPRIAGISLFAPINIVQGIYAKHYGLALTTIALVILFARLFDAVTDPIIGYLSDKSFLKSGSRKPFLVVGAFVMVFSGYFLYSPPVDVTVIYFIFWFMAFYLGFTLFEIPHLAWGGEISREAHAKTQTYNIRAAAGFGGLVLFYSIPLLPIWESREITPETLRFSAIVSGVLMLPLLHLCLGKVPDGVRFKGNPAYSEKQSLLIKLRFVTDNKPLLLFLVAFIFAGVGLGMWYGLVFIYVDAYLEKGQWFAGLYLVSFGVGAVASLLWIGVSKLVGKSRAWILAMLFGIASFGLTGLLDSSLSYVTLLILLIINTLCFSCIESIPQSMLSDIVDYSTLKYRAYRGSTYFSLYIFTYKAVFAVGGALGLAIAGIYGFDPASTSHSAESVSGLMLAMVWVPTSCVLISIVFIALSPITLKRHEIIRRRLQRLGERGSSDQSLALT